MLKHNVVIECKGISRKLLPAKSPFLLTLICVLYQNVFEMPVWGIGLMWTFVAFRWIGYLALLFIGLVALVSGKVVAESSETKTDELLGL